LKEVTVIRLSPSANMCERRLPMNQGNGVTIKRRLQVWCDEPIIMKPFVLFQAVLVFFLFIASPLQGQSLPNVPLDEMDLYRDYERAIACGYAKGYSFGDRPISRDTFLKLLGEIGTQEDEAAQLIYEDMFEYFEKDFSRFDPDSEIPTSNYFWEPITTVRSRLFFLDSPLDFRRLENSEGEQIEDGINHFLDISGRGQVTPYLSFFHQVQLNNSKETHRLFLKKGYGKLRWKNLALKVGRDSLRWGPAFRGTWVLSNNPKEFDMIQFRTEDPFRLPWVLKHLGQFQVNVGHIWLDDDRRVHKNPKLLTMRASYMPVSWFEVAINRSTQYGGSGMKEPSSAGDWLDLVTGAKERSKNRAFETETFVGYDLSLNLPFLGRLTRNIIKGGRIYQERASPDAGAPWQENQDEFRLTSDSNLYGIYLTTGQTDFRFEIADSEPETYAPDQYPNGYTYRRFIIGHPLPQARFSGP
jgi:hypothetical protein